MRFPPGRDQGVFLWIGDVVRTGGAPYRDAWETKGPLVFALSAAVRTVFGESVWGIRVFDAAVVGTTLAALVLTLRRAGAGEAAPWTAVVFAVLYTRLGWWDSSQPETWAAACMTGALCLTTFRSHDRRAAERIAAAGALVGAAALVKPFFALAWTMPAVMIWLSEDRPNRWRSLGTLTAGSLGAGILALVWLVSYGEGTINAFLDTHFRFNAAVYASTGGLPPLERVARMGGLLTSTPLLPAILLSLLALGAARRQAAVRITALEALTIASALWMVIALALVFVQGKFWPYQWTPLYPPLALLAGLGARRLFGFPDGSRIRRIASVVLIAQVLVGALEPAKWIAAWVRDTIIAPNATRWYAHFGDYDLEQGRLPALARYLRDSVPAGEPILVWGMEPVVYVLSGHAPPTRYGVNLPLVLGDDAPVRRRALAQFAADLAARRPYAIVVLDGDRNQLLDRTSRELLDRAPALQQLLARSYVAGLTLAAGRVYRLGSWTFQSS